MSGISTTTRLLVPVVLVLGSLLAGTIFERIIIARIKRLVARTKLKVDEILINALHGATTLWFLLAGLYFAGQSLTLNVDFSNILHKSLLVIAILSVTWVLARIAAGFVDLYSAKPEVPLPSTSIFVHLTRILVFILGILIIMQSLGISITPLLTALRVGGLAVALALQDTLSNLIAGFQIVASRQVRPGDYVQLDSG